MYTLINGSPKVISSNSEYFLNIVKNNIDEYKYHELKRVDYKTLLNDIEQSEAIVLAFPLYVDSPTAITLKLLDYIIDNEINLGGKNVYAIINCGFREGEQNTTAAEIIKRWCDKVKAIYSGAILIGAGEVVGKGKYKFISRKALKNIKKFSECIKIKKMTPDIITTIDYLNNKIYCILANNSWTKDGKKYKLSKKDLKIQ